MIDFDLDGTCWSSHLIFLKKKTLLFSLYCLQFFQNQLPVIYAVVVVYIQRWPLIIHNPTLNQKGEKAEEMISHAKKNFPPNKASSTSRAESNKNL